VGVRFIEFMPLDADEAWSRDKVVPAREILERIDAVFPLETTALAGSDATDGDVETPAGHVEPAARYRYRDGVGDVGVIASVTEPFCDNCDRVRLTAEGKLRTCLFALDETDLRVLLRGPGGLDDPDHDDDALDDRLAEALVGAVGRKWAGHRIGQVDFIRPDRSMSQIGG
jgi:cyclic pyranopterin phosphate synthase